MYRLQYIAHKSICTVQCDTPAELAALQHSTSWSGGGQKCVSGELSVMTNIGTDTGRQQAAQ